MRARRRSTFKERGCEKTSVEWLEYERGDKIGAVRGFFAGVLDNGYCFGVGCFAYEGAFSMIPACLPIAC